MKKIAMVNIKGGVGKTVSAVNLATGLVQKNKKVLLIDLDAQSNATQYLNRYNTASLSSYDVLNDKDLDIRNVIENTDIGGLDIIPANIKLVLSESEIVADTRRSRETRLQRALSKVESEYDYCIIDCPPSLGIITTNALVTSNDVLVPIKIDKFALDGFQYLLNTIEEIRDEFNPSLNLLGAFITMDKRTAVNREIKKLLKESLKDKLFDVTIRDNTKVTQSTFSEMPVMIYDPKSNASHDYVALTDIVISKCK